MIEINDKLSLMRVGGHTFKLWRCFERQMPGIWGNREPWKPVSMAMTTNQMLCWLEDNNTSMEAKERFKKANNL